MSTDNSSPRALRKWSGQGLIITDEREEEMELDEEEDAPKGAKSSPATVKITVEEPKPRLEKKAPVPILKTTEEVKTKLGGVVAGISCYNAEQSIASVVVQLKSASREIIVCDDGSEDRTGDIARALGCEVITLPRHYGERDAMRSLFLAASRKNPEVFLTMGADETSPSFFGVDIPKIIEAILKKDCDVLVGSRIAKGSFTPDVNQLRPKKGTGTSITEDVSGLDSNGDTIRDPSSIVRAYSGRALLKISPIGTYANTDYDTVLAFALKEAFRVHQFDLTSPRATTSPPQENLVVKSKEATKKRENALVKLMDLVSVRRPVVIFGAASLALFGMSVAFGFWSWSIYNAPKTLHDITYSGISFTVGSFVSSVVLLATASVHRAIKKFAP